MQSTGYIRGTVCVFHALLICGSAAGAVHAQDTASARQFGIGVSAGVVGAPLGSLAESYDARALGGIEYGMRVFRRNAGGTELSAALLRDEFRIDRAAEGARSASRYDSFAAVAGATWTEPSLRTVARYGLELGWRHYRASSARPSAYTGESEETRVRGNAALFAVSYGRQITAGATMIAPRLRLETSYPDLGGGDGYSRLHRARDLGFRASAGVELNRILLRR